MSNSKCPVATGVALTALDPVFRERPHEVLDCLRSTEPVHQDREFDRVFLTRAQDIGSVLNDRTMGTDPRKSRPGSFSRVQLGVDDKFQPAMVHMDDPDHKRLRDLVSKAFNQRSVDAMRTRIHETANRLLDQISDPHHFDVVERYAKPLPTIVIAEMMGVDPADQEEFKRWSDTQVHTFNPMRTAEQLTSLQQGKSALNHYFADLIGKRRKDRGTDLISTLISAEEEGERLSEPEIIGVCQFLMIAGNVSTTDLIGNGILALLQNPTELAKLLAQPELAQDAVEEVLRFDAPVTSASRINNTSREMDGGAIAAGQTITLSLLAANYDPAAHPNPHKFDIERADKRHHSFGGGAHYCLGAPLGRAEAQIAIPLILTRFPKMRLDPQNTLSRKALPSFNGLDSLWVRTD
jgi:predicted outer membrane repeat protein